MTPILIEPLSEQAYELLRQLEALHVLRVVSPPDQPAPTPVPRQWAGALAAISPASVESWNQYLTEIRNEWERDI
ncbi:hypothetical protein [uncultured Hymenobacter sp.]|uniref:hypothetical protein n=1 Tax=uncultured Hymenobacter sp. TaxID=170016 RepID=UPI0035CB2B8F